MRFLIIIAAYAVLLIFTMWLLSKFEMKITTIAGVSSLAQAGGSSDYQSIVRQGSWGAGNFPPCFCWKLRLAGNG